LIALVYVNVCMAGVRTHNSVEMRRAARACASSMPKPSWPIAPSTPTRPAPNAVRLLATVPPAPGVTSVCTTPMRGMPVSRDGSDAAES
jgi:hypothetical protein